MAGLRGRTLGGFQLAEQLPGGGIAEVYRGNPARPGSREVVVKVIHPEFARQPGFRQQFQAIVQSASQLASHPHILPLIASGDDGGYLYLVTPYVAAGTLRDRLRQSGPLGSADIAPFFRQVCDALGYAHSLGVVHGNVKPSNIFLFEGRHVLLGDFGLLWNVAQMDMDHSGSGTEAVEYLAPEVMAAQPTQQSDVYSVGAVLYSALVGHAPFQAAKVSEVFGAHARQPVPHLAQTHPSVSPPLLVLDGLIQRAMAKRPEDRFPSATAVAQAIETTLSQAPGLAVGSPAAQPGAAPGSTPFGALGAAAFPAGGFAPSVLQGILPASGVPPRSPASPAAPALNSLGQLNPPFPPLPSSGLVEGQMEQGRIQSSGLMAPPLPSSVATAPEADIPLQPTVHIASPPASEGLPPMTAPERESPWAGLMEDAEDGPAPQKLPAVRGLGTAPQGLRASGGPRPRAGFTIAGGSGNQGGPAGSQSLDGLEHAGDGEDSLGTFSSDLRDLSSEINDHTDGTWHVHEDAAPYGTEVREDEPARIPDGLPRLTSPVLRGMPPSWQEIVSGKLEAQGGMTGTRRNGRDGGADWEATYPSEPRRSGPGVPARDWQAEANGVWHGAAGDSWGHSLPGSRPLPAVPGRRDTSSSGNDLWDGASSGVADVPSFLQRSPQKDAGQIDEDEYRAFDDDRVWTQGLTAVRRKRRRWVRRLAFVLALVLLVDMVTLVVARPDLCPSAGCHELHSTLIQRFPALSRLGATPAPGLAVSANALSLTVIQGASVSAPVTLTNTAHTAINWRATSGLSWLAIDHAGGSLAAGARIQLTISAKAEGVKPGTYTGAITISSDSSSIAVTVTVVVNPHG